MTWLALRDQKDRQLSLDGLGIDQQNKPLLPDDPQTLLMRGTLVFETHMTPDQDPQVLFGFRTDRPAACSLTFQTTAAGGIAMVHVDTGRKLHAALAVPQVQEAEIIRVSYAWDVTARSARLTLERPGQMTLATTRVADPLPLSLSHIRGLMLGEGSNVFAPDLCFAALCNQIEPIGPMATLLPDTPIATPQGYQPISALRRGDTVLTRAAQVVPVLHRLTRVVPAIGSYRPIRLRAPYFGLRQDIIVAADQQILVDGPEVNYLFAQNAVLVPARHLVNGFSAIAEPCGPLVKYTQLLLPESNSILAAGTALSSLNIGHIAQNRDVLRGSMLHHLDRTGLPLHTASAYQVLNWSEAIHLARQRAA